MKKVKLLNGLKFLEAVSKITWCSCRLLHLLREMTDKVLLKIQNTLLIETFISPAGDSIIEVSKENHA